MDSNTLISLKKSFCNENVITYKLGTYSYEKTHL